MKETRHFIEWANKKGYTMVLSDEEIGHLIKALKIVRNTFFTIPFEDLEISYSPILDEEVSDEQPRNNKEV